MRNSGNREIEFEAAYSGRRVVKVLLHKALPAWLKKCFMRNTSINKGNNIIGCSCIAFTIIRSALMFNRPLKALFEINRRQNSLPLPPVVCHILAA